MNVFLHWVICAAVVVFRTSNSVHAVISYISEKNPLELVHNVVLNLNLILVMTFFKILVRIKRLNCEITTIYSVHLENFFAVGKVYFQYLSKYVFKNKEMCKRLYVQVLP